jgi:glutathione S-transferase
MTIKLHVFPLSPRGFKVLFAAHQLEIDYEFVLVDFSKQAQKTEAFTALNPNQRMPVLEDGDYCLWESNAIVQYLAALKPHGGLMPADLKTRMTAVKWQFWESAHWDPAVAIYMFENVVKKLFNIGAPDAAELKKGEAAIARLAPVLDAQLGKTRYATADTPTVADISLGATLVRADEAQIPLGEYRHIQRWRADIAALPGWQAAVARMKP